MPADPTPANGYALHPDHRLSVTLWSLILSSLHGRLTALEAVAEDWDEALGQQSTGLAQGILDDTVVPQFEAVQASIAELVAQTSLAGDQLASIQAGAVLAANVQLAPIGGLTAQTLQAALAEHQSEIAAVTAGLAAHLAAKATLVDANTGTSNARWMTALRTRQARMARRMTLDGPALLLPAEFGREINCISQSFTLALTAAGTMGDGWYCWVRNSSTANIVTLDPAEAETIDGMSTLRVYPGEAFMIICDGVAWHTVGRPKTVSLATVAIGGPAATIDFTLGVDDAEFVGLSLIGEDLRHDAGTSAVTLLRVREAGIWVDTGYVEGGGVVTAGIPLGAALPAATRADFAIDIRKAPAAASKTMLTGVASSEAGGAPATLYGRRDTAAAATGLRLLLDQAGGFSGGTVRLVGLRA